MKKFISTVILAATALVGSQSSLAECQSFSPFGEVVVFGDSLSDTSNLYNYAVAYPEILSDLSPLNPLTPEQIEQFFQLYGMTGGRMTNGAMMVEVAAAMSGCSLESSGHLLGSVQGNNFAVSGAKAVDEDGNLETADINLPTQVAAYLGASGGIADESALYVVEFGGNDIRKARDLVASGMATPDEAFESLKVAAKSAEQQIKKLIKAGANNVVVINSPDVSKIPETLLLAATVQDSGLVDFVSQLSAYYNSTLAAKMEKVIAKNEVNLVQFNLNEHWLHAIQSYSQLGINVTEACFSFFTGPNFQCKIATGESTIDASFMFFDDIHPMTEFYQQVGFLLGTQIQVELLN